MNSGILGTRSLATSSGETAEGTAPHDAARTPDITPSTSSNRRNISMGAGRRQGPLGNARGHRIFNFPLIGMKFDLQTPLVIEGTVVS